jgi:hypothetical protein
MLLVKNMYTHSQGYDHIAAAEHVRGSYDFP